jgi:Domain of unknown function (DUF4253)
MFSWLFGAKQKATPPPKGPAFPYPVQFVPVAQAIAAFDAIKAEAQGLPLFLGGAEDVANLAHQADMAAKEPAIIRDALAMAARFRFPQECWKHADGTIPDIHDDVAALRANPGEWPDAPDASRDIPAFYDFRTQGPRAQIALATIPTRDNAAVPAFMNFGGWNACPYPHVHVAALRKWNADWGAEIVSLTSDTMDVRVARRPQTRAAALELYLELVALHADTFMDGAPADYAAGLMVSDTWQLWWD